MNETVGVVFTRLTPEIISAVTGFVVAMLFALVPGLRKWFAGLDSQVKSWFMIGMWIVCGVAISALAVYQVIPCATQVTWADCLGVMLAWVVVNQPTYLILPQLADVRYAIMERNQNLIAMSKKRINK